MLPYPGSEDPADLAVLAGLRVADNDDNPVRLWKLSPMDIESLDEWDDYPGANEAVFFSTDTADALPFTRL